MNDERSPGDNDEKVTPLRRFSGPQDAIRCANDEALSLRYAALVQEHADLGAAIEALEASPRHDRLSVARLKKKKLLLKDQMQTIKDQMTPDIIA
jgi:hypothetical protein